MIVATGGRAMRFCLAGAAAVAFWAGNAQAQVGANVRTALATVSSQLAAGDVVGARGQLSGLQASSPMEKYLIASAQLEIASRSGDVRAQHKAASDMMSSGLAPENQRPFLHHVMGYAAFQGGDMKNAIDQLSRAQALGYANPQASLLLAEAWLRQRKPANALPVITSVIDRQVQANTPVPVAWLDRAASTAQAAGNWPAFARFESMRLRTGATPGEWRTAIVSYLAGAAPDKEMQLDLMRLQAATGALASERDYQAYATLASSAGRAAEAKAIIESGRAKGDLAAGDSVTAPLFNSLTAKAKQNLAAITPLVGKAGSAKSAQASADAGDQLLSAGQYAEAAKYYRAAAAAAPTDRDRVNTRLGIALARSGDVAGAQQAFAQANGRWADVAAYWNSWTVAQASPTTSPVVATPPRLAPAQ